MRCAFLISRYHRTTQYAGAHYAIREPVSTTNTPRIIKLNEKHNCPPIHIIIRQHIPHNLHIHHCCKKNNQHQTRQLQNIQRTIKKHRSSSLLYLDVRYTSPSRKFYYPVTNPSESACFSILSHSVDTRLKHYMLSISQTTQSNLGLCISQIHRTQALLNPIP